MGFIGKIVNQVIGESVREIVTEIIKNYTRVSVQACPPGIDGAPCSDDQGISMILSGSNKSINIGVYPDASALPGELRLYGRAANGTLKSLIHFKNDGKITVEADGLISFESALAGALEKTVLGETLKTKLDAILDGIVAITVPTGVGPSGTPVNAATFTAIKAGMAAILSAGAKNN